MARTTIPIKKLDAGEKDDLLNRLSTLDGVRSVVPDDSGRRIEVEYDETLVGENKLIELARREREEPDIPTIATGPRRTG